MSKDKQIEEMAKELKEVLAHNTRWNSRGEVISFNHEGGAKELYDDGYRKASDVAEEIFAEIEAEYGKQSGADRGDDLTYGQVQDFFAELKKKYNVTDTNVGCKTEEGK